MPIRPGRQELNPVDRLMWCVDRALRGMRYPGFKTQMLLWLAGRADGAGLRRGIARLSRRYPVIASRLVETAGDDDAEVYWRFRPGAICPLTETDLSSADRKTVLDFAGKLLSEAYQPAQADPISFHLLHRPDGRDVFLVQYQHMLMDNNATVPVLRLIDRLSGLDGDADEAEVPQRDGIRQFLRRVPYAKRRAAALAGINLQGRVHRGRAAILGKGEEDVPRNVRLHIATHELAPAHTEALRNRVVEICGLPSLSMAILGSVFRGIAHFAQHKANRTFVAGIGLDLNARNGQGPFFQNLMSMVPISAAADHLSDRDELVRFLAHQMRQRLSSGIDLGALQMTSVFSRRPRHIRWVVEHMLRYSTSLWYAYFGSLDSLGRQFCGAEIEDAFFTGPTWSPVGLTLLVNQFRQRLLFQATYDPQLVPPPLVKEFLQFVVNDLPR